MPTTALYFSVGFKKQQVIAAIQIHDGHKFAAFVIKVLHGTL
jgi:hypothetical protein